MLPILACLLVVAGAVYLLVNTTPSLFLFEFLQSVLGPENEERRERSQGERERVDPDLGAPYNASKRC